MCFPYAGSWLVFRRGKKQREEIEAQFEAEVAALRRTAEEIGASDQLTEEESAVKLQAACEQDACTIHHHHTSIAVHRLACPCIECFQRHRERFSGQRGVLRYLGSKYRSRAGVCVVGCACPRYKKDI